MFCRRRRPRPGRAGLGWNSVRLGPESLVTAVGPLPSQVAADVPVTVTVALTVTMIMMILVIPGPEPGKP